MKLYLFPFDRIEKGSKAVIYGTGVVGQEYLRQNNGAGDYCTVLTLLNSEKNGFEIDGIPVKKPKDALPELREADAIVIALSRKADREEVIRSLRDLEVEARKIVDDIRIVHFNDRCKLDMLADEPAEQFFPEYIKETLNKSHMLSNALSPGIF